MKHLGDITLIKGYEAPVVDCIVGGSPCQDLSLAGKRAGLAGARSGLYMEQIRIIKEMRDNDRANGRTGVDVRPRYMVWENVPGAFSTNKGQDFAAVLEEAIRVAEPEAPSVPVPEKGWPTAGCIMGEQWSVAWRVLDAQFWGTSDKPLPQRRRRIALVADFGGLSAPEILFVRKGVSGNIEPGKPKGKEAPRDVGESSGGAVPYTLKIRSGVEVDSGGRAAGKGALIQTDKCATLSTVQDQTLFQPIISVDQGGGKSSVCTYDGVSPTLTSTNDGAPAVVYGISPYHSNCMKSDNPHSGIYVADTSRSLDAMNCGYPGCNQGGMAVVQPVTVCLEGNGSRPSHKGDGYCESDTMYTLNATEHHAVAYSLEPGIAAREGGHFYDGVSGTLRAKAGDNQMAVAYSINHQGGNVEQIIEGKTGTLTASMNSSGNNKLSVAYSIENHPADSRVDIDESGKVQTLTSRMGTGGGNVPMVMEPVGYEMQAFGKYKNSGCASSLKARDYKDATDLVVSGDPICIDRAFFNQGQNALYEPQCYEDGTVPTLVAKGPAAVSVKHIVRRLTPLECERLQGFPDGWTDIGEWIDSKGKKHKEADSPRYKALGNSIALPPWKWVLKRLCACYERDATMASLFDGIGGFPYIWEQLNGKGSCLWASEIEEFPMAVTKLRFGGNDNENYVR